MLVLSRQRNESIRIGDNIQIVVIEIRGDKVRLGLDAPADVAIHRTEVFEAIQRAAANGEEIRELATPHKVAVVSRGPLIAFAADLRAQRRKLASGPVADFCDDVVRRLTTILAQEAA